MEEQKEIMKKGVFLFGNCRLDAEAKRLWQGEEPLYLRPKSFEVLQYLLERWREKRAKGSTDPLITKEEILKGAWKETVELGTVGDTVKDVQRVLKDRPSTRWFIDVVYKQGYRSLVEIKFIETPLKTQTTEGEEEPTKTQTTEEKNPREPVHVVRKKIDNEEMKEELRQLRDRLSMSTQSNELTSHQSVPKPRGRSGRAQKPERRQTSRP